jgi:minor curlin subunit
MKALTPLLLSGALLAALPSWAQTERRTSEAATAEQRLAEDLGYEQLSNAVALPPATAGRNVSALQQNGNRNNALIDQQTLSTLGNQAYVQQVGTQNAMELVQRQGGNVATITQNGNGNQANYTQDGRGNNTVISQSGRANKVQGVTAGSDFLLQGDNNVMKIDQNGNNNVVQGEVRENNRLYEIRQTGNNNTLKQVESSSALPKGYSVEMKGQGINITIEQGRAGY